MARIEQERLAAALRANLRRRKAEAPHMPPEPSLGPDEEGDVIVSEDEGRTGAWVSEGSKKD